MVQQNKLHTHKTSTLTQSYYTLDDDDFLTRNRLSRTLRFSCSFSRLWFETLDWDEILLTSFYDKDQNTIADHGSEPWTDKFMNLLVDLLFVKVQNTISRPQFWHLVTMDSTTEALIIHPQFRLETTDLAPLGRLILSGQGQHDASVLCRWFCPPYWSDPARLHLTYSVIRKWRFLPVFEIRWTVEFLWFILIIRLSR